MASRKDYRDTAYKLYRAFWDTSSEGLTNGEKACWQNGFGKAVEAIADHFASDNGRFDRERFTRAVYIGEEVI